jgi:alpha-L-fucosidase
LLSTTSGDAGVTIGVPASAPDPIASTVVLEVEGRIEVESPVLAQGADGKVSLPAAEAILRGETLRYEGGHDRDNVGYWTDPKEWVEWEFKVSRPGTFEATASIAALESGSFRVTVGDRSIEGKAPVTGNYGKFEKVALGRLELSAGKVRLAVRPVEAGWKPMNLRAIELEPAK